MLDPGPLGFDESVIIFGLGAGKSPACALPGVFGVLGPPPIGFNLKKY